MLAGEHAADLDAELQDIGAERLGALKLARVHAIEDDEGMQIAVAGMENIAEAKPVFGRHLRHPRQHRRQLVARDRAVHAQHVGRQPPHRRERCLAPGPELGALHFVAGLAHLGAVVPRDVADAGDGVVDLHRDAVGIDDQDALARRIARRRMRLHRFDAAAVHEFHRRRHDARRDDVRDALSRIGHAGKGGEQGPRRGRPGQDAHRRLDHDAEKSFGAAHHAEQIEPARPRRLAAEPEALAGHQHEFDAEQVVRGQSVFQAMQPAGILRDIAADGAGDLAGGIGSIVESMPLHRAGDRQIGHAGLRHHAAVLQIDLADAVHPGHREQDAVGARQRPARQRRPRAARHHRHAMLARVSQDGRDLLRIARQHGDERLLAIGGQRVAVECGEPCRIGHHAVGHDGAQRSDDVGAMGDDVGIGRQKPHCGLIAVSLNFRLRGGDEVAAYSYCSMEG